MIIVILNSYMVVPSGVFNESTSTFDSVLFDEVTFDSELSNEA